ncbi:MAG: hypothetical protein RIT27_763 [Pseudomonadota bacterium]|jgi:uncharacterized protein involved in tellurium resistance
MSNTAEIRTNLIKSLTVRDLRKLAKYFGIECESSTKKDQLVKIVMNSDIRVYEIANTWNEAQVKEFCQQIGMDSVGRKNTLLKKLPAFLNESEIIREPIEKKKPDLPPENFEELKELEQFINQLVLLGKIEIGKINRGFCAACSKMHAKRWFNFTDQEASFYICRIGSPTVIIRRGENYENLTTVEFLHKYKNPDLDKEKQTYQLLLQKYVEVSNNPDLKTEIANLNSTDLKFVDLTSEQSRSSGAAVTYFGNTLNNIWTFLKTEEADQILRHVPVVYTAIKLGQTFEAYRNFQNTTPDSEQSVKVLEQSKDFSEISSVFNYIAVTLSWTQAIDLDLYAFYRAKDGKIGEIFYDNKGSLRNFPFIKLDGDSGIGNTGGDNEENLIITSISEMDYILIAVNIYKEKGFFSFFKKEDSFARYDGKILVQPDIKQPVEIPLSSPESGEWCVVAGIDNRGEIPRVLNINSVEKKKPDLKQWNFPT